MVATTGGDVDVRTSPRDLTGEVRVALRPGFGEFWTKVLLHVAHAHASDRLEVTVRGSSITAFSFYPYEAEDRFKYAEVDMSGMPSEVTGFHAGQLFELYHVDLRTLEPDDLRVEAKLT
jgi:hypothetical protein